MTAVGYFVGWLNLLHQCLSEIILTQRSSETDQIVILLIVYAGLFGRIADTLQEGRLASVGSADDKNTEVSIFLSDFEGFCDIGHVCSG